MGRRKQDIVLLCTSVGAFLLSSLSFLVMPVPVPGIPPRTQSVLMGSVFWGFLIVGAVLQVILSRRRTAWIRENHLQRNRNFWNAKVGVAAFAKNRFGCIADVLTGLSLIGLILAVVLTKNVGYVCYIALTALEFTFCLHCILNGKIFFYVQNQDKILFEREKEQQQRKEKEKETWLGSKIR